MIYGGAPSSSGEANESVTCSAMSCLAEQPTIVAWPGSIAVLFLRYRGKSRPLNGPCRAIPWGNAIPSQTLGFSASEGNPRLRILHP